MILILLGIGIYMVVGTMLEWPIRGPVTYDSIYLAGVIFITGGCVLYENGRRRPGA